MFRRKDEGTEATPETTAANPASEVQVPPAPQGQNDTNSLLYGSASAYSSPAASSSAYGGSSESKSATAGSASPSSTGSAYASPYRSPAANASSSSAGSNVTELSGRSGTSSSASSSSSAPSSRFAEPTTRTGSSSMDKTSTKSASKNRVLTVGNDILMKGEINSCDRIVIEGAVDATLKDVHTMEIAESGSFKGMAEVEEAEISGTVEGDLTVRGRLIIYSTGKVTGKVSYGEIEIERGGKLTGEVKTGGTTSASSANTNKAAA